MKSTTQAVSSVVAIAILIGVTVTLSSLAAVEIFNFGASLEPNQEASELRFTQVNATAVEVSVRSPSSTNQLTIQGPNGDKELLTVRAGNSVIYGDSELSLQSGETLNVIRQSGTKQIIETYTRP